VACLEASRKLDRLWPDHRPANVELDLRMCAKRNVAWVAEVVAAVEERGHVPARRADPLGTKLRGEEDSVRSSGTRSAFAIQPNVVNRGTPRANRVESPGAAPRGSERARARVARSDTDGFRLGAARATSRREGSVGAAGTDSAGVILDSGCGYQPPPPKP
jgi:hypothetical protein